MGYTLNESQRQAVESDHRRILCLAGAGTGKTRTLAARIARLYKEREGAIHMTALTFTRMAGQELKRRVAKEIGEEGARRIFCDTFHAFALRIISEHGRRIGIREGCTIYDDLDRESIFTRIIEDGHLDATASKSMEIYLQNGKGPAVFSTDPRKQITKARDHERLIREYNKRLMSNNAVDLSRLIEHANELLAFQDIAAQIKEKCHHLFIDEYQDTSADQNKMVGLIDPENIFAVGDDYQSIYEWRDARPEFIIYLSRDSGWQTIRLEINYRSVAPIIALANGIIKKNRNRTDKTLISNAGGDLGVYINEYETIAEEADAICRCIQEDPGEPLAVLCRTNRQVSDIGRYVREKGLQAVTISGKYDPMRRPYVRQLIQVMHLATNPEDDHAFLSTIYAFKNYIDPERLAVIRTKAALMDIPLMAQAAEDGEAAEFIDMIDSIREEEVAADAFNKILTMTGITEKNERQGLDNRNEDIWETLYRINKWEARQLEAGESVSPMAFCQWVMIKDIQAGLIENADQPIKIMTIHAAKGLEFDRVIIPGVTAGTFPSIRSDIEEERRLFFVAITRAEWWLMISTPREKTTFQGKRIPAQPSQFFNEAKEIAGAALAHDGELGYNTNAM